MKLEPRGKFGGVKIHLDANETQQLLNATAAPFEGALHKVPVTNLQISAQLADRMGRKVRELMKEHTDLLQDKSPEQVAKELQLEIDKSQKKLQLLAGGNKWSAKDGLSKHPAVQAIVEKASKK